LADIYRLEIPDGVIFLPIAQNATGTLLFGIAGKRIVVLSTWLIAANQVAAKFQTSTGPTDLSGPANCAQFGGFVLNFNAGGWFQTLPGDSLILNLNAGVAVGGSLSYALV